MSMTYRELLLDDVLSQIVKDVESGDMTAIHEMLLHLPDNVLYSFLSEVPSDE